MRMAIETITPERAAQYLELHDTNRPLKTFWVSMLATSIKRGEWKENGEAIKFSKSKKLIDGQHRLHAIIAAGIPIKTAVIFGVPDDAFDTIDQTKRRSAQDVLAMQGEKNTVLLAGAVRCALSCEARWAGSYYNNFYSTPQVEAGLLAHPTIRDITEMAASAKSRGFTNSQVVGVLGLAAEKHGFELAATFLDRYMRGADLPEKSPILVLRDRMLERSPTARISSEAIAVMSIKAWNFWLQKKEISQLRFSRDESFPRIQ